MTPSPNPGQRNPGRAHRSLLPSIPVASRAVDASHDVLVIGAGCAGMRAAIEAFDAGVDVALVSKLHPTRSHSGAAEGGINAPLGNVEDDSPDLQAFDTVKGSDYLGDQDSIEILCREAPGDIYQLEHWGAVFSRAEDGRLAQRPFGAAGSPRTVYAAVDEARCIYGRRHTCPSRLCSCGFYCMHAPSEALALTCATEYRGAVVLEVGVLGSYIRYEHGMRYQRQRVHRVSVGH